MVAILSFATYRSELSKVVLGLFLVTWLAFSNSDPYKIRFPGLDRFYLRPVRASPSAEASEWEYSPGTKEDDPLQRLARKKREIESLVPPQRPGPAIRRP